MQTQLQEYAGRTLHESWQHFDGRCKVHKDNACKQNLQDGPPKKHPLVTQLLKRWSHLCAKKQISRLQFSPKVHSVVLYLQQKTTTRCLGGHSKGLQVSTTLA